MVESIIKQLLSLNETLHGYKNGLPTSINDIKRHLFLLARSENKVIPDQHYHLLKEKELDEINSLESLLGKGLHDLSKAYLEIREQKIYVQQSKQTEWQDLITYIPPLVLQSAFLVGIRKPKSNQQGDLLEYFRDYLLPNFKYTALPYPFIPQLDLYVQEHKGLHDLHMHLNGSTETDVIWLAMLQKPDEVYNSLKEGFEKEKVKEQYEQETNQFSPLEYLALTKTAQRIRRLLFDFVFPTNSTPYQELGSNDRILEELLKENGSLIHGNYQHPFQEIITDNEHYQHPLAIEALMFVLVFGYFEQEDAKPIVAKAFHFYLLILGLTNRLLVQQIHQNGFDQFQKITLNDIRWFTEQDYKHRFKQLHGNELRNLRFLEGRFAPKETEPQTLKLLNDIKLGWKDLIELLKSGHKSNAKLPQLKLTAHFIKQGEPKKDEFIRHKKLRKDTWKKSFVLAKLLENNQADKELITAADAASNEFDAPPEVFSPIFRYLRRKGIRHFTYHAGEDFFHIIGGMRAVYEAYSFSDFNCGDRIGHATALGLNPELWMNNLGKKMLIRQGEWLDDLVFVYHVIVKYKVDALKKYIPFINNKVQELHYDIYGKHETVPMLEKAWLARKWCILHLMAEKEKDVHISFGHNEEELNEVLCAIKKDTQCCQIVFDYHNNQYRKNYEKIIERETNEFSVTDLKELQLAVLKEMHQKEIVIETLPTSNVRIGHHKDYSTHQLWNWLKWEEEGKAIPPIVMGSDDTGIFATSIYNEYANLYCCATQQLGFSHNKIMAIIEKLDRNGRIYRFS